MSELRMLLTFLDHGKLSYDLLPHFSRLLRDAGPNEFPRGHRLFMRLIQRELEKGTACEHEVLEKCLHWLHMLTIGRCNHIHHAAAEGIFGSFPVLAEALIMVFSHLLPPGFQPEDATGHRLTLISQTFDCIAIFFRCLEMNNTTFTAVLPRSVYEGIVVIHFDVWMFYSRYLPSDTIFIKGMATISGNFWHVIFPSSRFAENHPKIIAYLNTIPDCAHLCISNFARTKRLHNEFSRTSIFLATHGFKEIIDNELCHGHQAELERNPKLRPLIIQNAHRILTSPHPIHTDVQAQFIHLAYIVRLEAGNFAAHLTKFDRARTLAHGLNAGLWCVCKRLLLLGQCSCPEVPAGSRVCPWSASVILGEDGREVVRQAVDFVASRVVELLLEGQLSVFRQMEKALRRNDNASQSFGEYLPELDVPQWKLMCQEIVLILGKRRTYNSLERPDLCANEECPKVTCAAKNLRWCHSCHLAYYCSRKCQKFDWRNGHSESCQVLLRQHKYPEIASNVDDDFVDWLRQDSPHLYDSEEEESSAEEDQSGVESE